MAARRPPPHLPPSPPPQASRKAEGKPAKKLRKGQGLLMDAPSRPSEAELRMNSRSRSAVLHILRKESGVTVAALEAAVYKARKWGSPPGEELAGAGGAAELGEEEAAEGRGGKKEGKKGRAARASSPS